MSQKNILNLITNISQKNILNFINLGYFFGLYLCFMRVVIYFPDFNGFYVQI